MQVAQKVIENLFRPNVFAVIWVISLTAGFYDAVAIDHYRFSVFPWWVQLIGLYALGGYLWHELKSGSNNKRDIFIIYCSGYVMAAIFAAGGIGLID